MNFSAFFIKRPIFAACLSLVTLLAGLIAMFKLPISEYPEISPPSIVVNASFPGANPQVIAETVAAPLEEQINGVENMLYMFSQSTTDGRLTLTVTFAIGTDPDLAQQLVQNRVNQALPRLPDITRQIGLTTVKSSPDLTMVVHITSPNDRYDSLYLRNYSLINIKDRLTKIKGIGQIGIFGGGDYAMRIWLDPEKMALRNLAVSDVIQAVRKQNLQASVGMIGGEPKTNIVDVQLPIQAKGRLENPEDFANIILKTGQIGEVTYLSDVATVEMGASSYSIRSLLDNKNAVALAIYGTPDANALNISEEVRKMMVKIKKSFPEGVDYNIVYDPTIFVKQSIDSVISTLLEAVLLVVMVVVIFLQRWRAAIIPLLAVPVSIIGTFALMFVFGFSINVLSLFGLILAIGIVVDDAIIVVENVERNIEEGLSPHDATVKAMKEVTGPIIATTLVLLAVFVPISFISGLTGQFYQQFSLTIAISTVISAFNSLTLSPALSAVLLQPHHHPQDMLSRILNRLLGWFFKLFNRFFNNQSNRYASGVSSLLKRRFIGLGVYIGLLVGTYYIFYAVPKGFIPSQDKQYLIAFAQLPEGAVLDRSEKVIREMSSIALETPGVAHSVAFPGLSINGFTNSSSAGIVFVTLDDFSKRKTPNLSGFAIAQTLQEKFNAIQEGYIAIFPPPPVMGLGTTGGFKLQIQDKANQGYQALNNVLQQVLGQAYQNPMLSQVYSSYKINAPQLQADFDRTKAMQLGLSAGDVFETMQVYLGSFYINDFNKFGRTYQVIAQAKGEFRDTPDDILNLKVRNSLGDMIPLGSVLDVKDSFGPETASRYNGFLSADINGSPNVGYSSGQAEEAMISILEKTLPAGMDFEWTDLKYQQILSGDTTLYVLPLVIFLVFLVLAAQYESLILPLAIILIIPLAVVSALFGVWLMGGDNNIFTQISLFVLIGLATKNAILIVEFARELEHQGYSALQAAIHACRLRLRPILMTSLAFIMGVLPLVVSSGAGAEMRQALGIAVFAGMIGVTIFGLFLTPVFYILLRKGKGKGDSNGQDLSHQNHPLH